MDSISNLISEIERAANALGVAPSTIGQRANQGGRFYARLKEGKQVLPKTAQSVLDWIEANAPAPKRSKRKTGAEQ